MAKKNIVDLQHAVQHLVKSPWGSCDAQSLVVAAGVCNDRPFEAILIYDEGITSSVNLYNSHNVIFTKDEYQSIRRKLKSVTPEQTFDHRGEPAPEGYSSFYHKLVTDMDEKFYGHKIYLDVQFSEKDAVKQLGGQWDGGEKKWYVMSKAPNIESFAPWMTKPEKQVENEPGLSEAEEAVGLSL